MADDTKPALLAMPAARQGRTAQPEGVYITPHVSMIAHTGRPPDDGGYDGPNQPQNGQPMQSGHQDRPHNGNGNNCGLQADQGNCCPTGAFNAIGGVNETASVSCAEDQRCSEPGEWWQWECEGTENVPPVLFKGVAPGSQAWETTTADFPRGFRDRELARHFLRHAGWFQTSPTSFDAVLIGADLVAAVAPPLFSGLLPFPVQTMFTAVRLDINTPYLQFAGEQLTATIGSSPLNPNSALDNSPFIINSMNEGPVTPAPRGIIGWQRQHKISLVLPLGVVRLNQTVPNIGLGVFERTIGPGGGALIPFNVRLAGFSAGTTMKASLVANASAGISDFARSV